MPTPRSTEEIDEQRNLADEQVETGGSRWPGMSYEQGVANALAWAMGDVDDPPMED